MNNFYNEILTEHNVRPEFKFDLPDATLKLEGVNPNCGDDIWLKLIEIMSGVPVVAAMPCEDLRYLPGSQEVGLYHKNVDADQNDVQLQKIEGWLKTEYGDNALTKKILEYDGEPVEDALIRVCECHEKERRELRDEIGRNSRQLKKACLQGKVRDKCQASKNIQGKVGDKCKTTADI